MLLKKLSAHYVNVSDRIVIMIYLEEDLIRMSLTRRMLKLLLDELNRQIKKLNSTDLDATPKKSKSKQKKENLKKSSIVDQKPPSLITGFVFKPKSENKVSISIRCQDKNNLNLAVGKKFLGNLMDLLKNLAIKAEWDIAPKKTGAKKVNTSYKIDKSKLH